MGRAVRWGSVRYWALVLSVVLHAGALAVFTGVRLAGDVRQRAAERPMLTMQAIERAAAKPKPVPRVEPIAPAKVEKPVEESPLVATKEPPLEKEAAAPEPVEMAEADASDEISPAMEPEVEFFGQKSVLRHICYVVDCSGSMYGQMYHVKEQLKQSILKLDSSQAFCVLFFMDGREVLMSGGGRLEAATAVTKSHAMALIAAVRPKGSTDAAHALETAMRLKGPDGYGPQVIYFLTDGFDLDAAGSLSFLQEITLLRASLAPEAVIHTIGFHPQAQDRRTLFAMAQDTGGGYVEVD